MRAVFFSLALICSVETALSEDRDEAITGVISDQIAAFKADDFATAFTYASPQIRRMFQHPNMFGLMVRQGYPMVWRPKSVQFLALDLSAAQPVQRVLIEDQSGLFHLLDYFMVPSKDGWRINGVELVQDEPGQV